MELKTPSPASRKRKLPAPFQSPTPPEDDVDYEEFGGKPEGGAADEIVEKAKSELKAVDHERKIFIIQATEDEVEKKSPLIVSIPHPKNEKPSRYILFEDRILEIQRCLDQPSSWFVDQTIQKDGSLYLCTPIDPLFLAIPLLEKNRKKTTEHAGYFVDVAQMISDNSTGYLQVLKQCDLSLICDVNADLEQPLYRLNDDKLLEWLTVKLDRLINKLTTSGHIQQGNAQSTTFRSSAAEKILSDSDIMRGALGFLSEYITKEQTSKLAQSKGLKHYGVQKVTALDSLGDRIAQSPKSETPKSPPTKKQKLTPGQQKLAKTNLKGMNSISSFFKKQ